MDLIHTSAGRPLETGTMVTAKGVYFSVYSRNATAIFLELFSTPDAEKPAHTIELTSEKNRTGDMWHVFVEGLKPGALYLYRADGPNDISKGFRFNKNQYLFDPFAKAFTDGSVFRYLKPGRQWDLSKAPKCVVVDDDDYDWGDDHPLRIPLERSIIYEMHVKGFTASPTSNVCEPGTYKGVTEKIPYLQSLGISAVELLPIMEFDEYENMNINPRTGSPLKNYWGYSTIGFFAPKTKYSSDKTPGGAVREFKDMIKAFHNAGIEVILDVVFNHTAEGNEKGITLNFRGFDNSIFYHLTNSNKQYYQNYTGCGNSINANHPVVQNFILNCLRYWVIKMHVDGFRFDLATELTRDENGFVSTSTPLTRRIAEDPVLSNTKIIAEPWDADGGYQIGNFPGGRWCEWNDHYRDGIRKFIRGDEHTSTEAATRISGSSDLYSLSGRGPIHSINYIDAHDGFTLNDLVTYNFKHNDDNGEENRDGSDNNLSYNYGCEGPVINPKIESKRIRQIKNFFTALLVSQGVPMFAAGDETRRTQNGNNNAYCQDNEESWLNWDNVENNATLYEFVQTLITMRAKHSVFHRRNFFGGNSTSRFNNPPDISWFDSNAMVPDWEKLSRFLAFRLGGRATGLKEEDNDFYIAMNMDIHDMTLTIPGASAGNKWFRLVDTSIENRKAALLSSQAEELQNQKHYVILANSILVLISKPIEKQENLQEEKI